MGESQGVAATVQTLREVVALARDLALVALIAVPFLSLDCAVEAVKKVRVGMRDAGVDRASFLGIELTAATEEAALRTQLAGEKLQEVKDTPGLSTADQQKAVNEALELVTSASARLQSAEQRVKASAPGTRSTSDREAWVAVVGADRDLPGAQDELARTRTAGFTGGFIALREGWYRTVIPFPSRAAAESSLSSVHQQIRSGAYLRELGSWCLDQEKLPDGVIRCGAAS
jgi:hypothetical protein